MGSDVCFRKFMMPGEQEDVHASSQFIRNFLIMYTNTEQVEAFQLEITRVR